LKKIALFIAGLFITSSFAVVGFGHESGNRTEILELNFLEPKTIEKQSFVELEIEGSNNHIFIPGNPMLPTYTKTIILPFGAKNIDIQYEVTQIETMPLSEKVSPAPQRIIEDDSVSFDNSNISIMDETIYSSPEYFPENWFNYNIGVGLDGNNQHKTLLTINTYPVRYSPATNTIEYVKNIDIKVSYEEPDSNPFPSLSTYDLVIIAPSEFTSDLQSLVDHKNSIGVKTIMKTTDEIYTQYNGVDKPEKIKYFIKDSLETWGIKYVLLVGGLKSWIWANPKENANYGSKGWRLPVRYANLIDFEPGIISDLYYADIYKEGGVFDNWDSNNDGIFAYKLGMGGTKNDKLDLYPDVYIGRLPCRNNKEVQGVVDKIIKYESQPLDPSWFNKMIVVSGDGFLDQEDLGFQWDTNGLPTGDYTIYAQSTNPEGISGPIDETHVTLDKTQNTNLTFNHNDYLLVPNFPSYPALPIAKIMTVSSGNILGKDDYSYTPGDGEAYCNEYTGYGNVKYKNGILHLSGKTYDPKPYGYTTNISMWIKNSAGEIVFEDRRNNSLMYYEGEWTVGEQMLHERAGGLYYMPTDIQKEIIWTSNGKWTSQSDVINSINKGSGFIFFSGHGSPAVWGDQYPGIPGNRRIGSVTGLSVVNVKGNPAYLPMETLTNDYKNPVVVVGGCHNSMFNVSLIETMLELFGSRGMQSYGNPTAECWSEWIMRLSKRGAIASIGNTGYGFGNLGEWCTVGGVDNWITTEFFKQYGTEGRDILGEAHGQSISSYISTFSKTDSGDLQTVEQWVLLGDPSLKIGGYNT
jgi:Peptidase family C25/Propeptide_C25